MGKDKKYVRTLYSVLLSSFGTSGCGCGCGGGGASTPSARTSCAGTPTGGGGGGGDDALDNLDVFDVRRS
jgi:hypothetical protein